MWYTVSMIRPYTKTHQQGTISFENIRSAVGELIGGADCSYITGDLGIQIAKDGRVWVCINGVAFIRFSPHPDDAMSKETLPKNSAEDRTLAAWDRVIYKRR